MVNFKFNHSIEFSNTATQLANLAKSPICVITIKPEYSESVHAALEKDEIGFYTKYVLWFYFDIS